jgi:hypothetical protein
MSVITFLDVVALLPYTGGGGGGGGGAASTSRAAFGLTAHQFQPNAAV